MQPKLLFVMARGAGDGLLFVVLLGVIHGADAAKILFHKCTTHLFAAWILQFQLNGKSLRFFHDRMLVIRKRSIWMRSCRDDNIHTRWDFASN
jgi:hypothetical protein